MDYISWHSWLLTKQKRLEFYVKSREEKTFNEGKPYQLP